jgi:hypothetical protein
MGSLCGILELQAINGLVFFIGSSILSSFLYYMYINRFTTTEKGRANISEYFEYPVREVLLGNIGRQIATFTMMWCLLGALISH